MVLVEGTVEVEGKKDLDTAGGMIIELDVGLDKLIWGTTAIPCEGELKGEDSLLGTQGEEGEEEGEKEQLLSWEGDEQ